MKEMDSTPDYVRIYSDILDMKFPHKKKICRQILKKERITVLDVIELNNKIFEAPNKENVDFNQKHRSYSKEDILYLLDYQKKHRLNNSQLANHFKLSRNTVTKWKRIFLV
jgi:hypothetical protein